jgi:hypothetical protein
VPARFLQWQNALIDLSLRNPLLNLSDRTGVRIAVPGDLGGRIEDRLAAGKRLVVWPYDDLGAVHEARAPQRSVADVDEEVVRDLLARTSAVVVDVPLESYATTFRTLAYKARTVLEEMGANALHLTLGELVWEHDGRELGGRQSRAGPCGERRYEIVADDTGQPTPNFCLAEKLRQTHQLDLTMLEAPPVDAHGLDLPQLFTQVRAALAEQSLPFRVEMASRLAVLQFAKFRLWRDIADHWQAMLESPLVRHLALTPTHDFTDPAVSAVDVVPDLDGLGARCPIPADASQVGAIAAALQGRTFVLEGPPGTGKSQTITNLLARAVAEGHRVLFVAEKQAALEVVKRRLDDVGLASISLDLHDKSAKPSAIRRQIQQALDLVADSDGAQLALTREEQAARRRPWRATSTPCPPTGPGCRSARRSARGPRRAHARTARGGGTRSRRVDRGRSGGRPVVARRRRSGRPRSVALGVRHHPAAGRAGREGGRDIETLRAPHGNGGRRPVVACSRLVSHARGDPSPRRPVRVARHHARNDRADLFPELGSTARSGDGSGASPGGGGARCLHPHGAGPRPPRAAPRRPGRRGVVLPVPQAAAARGGRTDVLGSLLPGRSIEPSGLVATVGALIAARDRGTHLALAIVDRMPNLALPPGWHPWRAEASRAWRLRDAVGRAAAVADPRVSRPELAAVVREALSPHGPVDDGVRSRAFETAAAMGDLAGLLAVTDEGAAAWSGDAGFAPRWRATAARRALSDGGHSSLRAWLALVAQVEPLRTAALTAAAEQLLTGRLDPDLSTLSLEAGLSEATVVERLARGQLGTFQGDVHERGIDRYRASASALRVAERDGLLDTALGRRTFAATAEVGRVGALRREVARRRGGKSVRDLLVTYADLIAEIMPCASFTRLRRAYPVRPACSTSWCSMRRRRSRWPTRWAPLPAPRPSWSWATRSRCPPRRSPRSSPRAATTMRLPGRWPTRSRFSPSASKPDSRGTGSRGITAARTNR